MFELNLLKVINHGNAIENLKDSGVNVTLSGVLIVFAMLVLLVIILAVFGNIMSNLAGNKNKDKVVKEVKNIQPAPSVPVAKTAESTDYDDDVIAAISAAVMMMYEGTGKTPVIRSIRPAQKGVRSAWAMAGIMNNTRSF